MTPVILRGAERSRRISIRCRCSLFKTHSQSAGDSATARRMTGFSCCGSGCPTVKCHSARSGAESQSLHPAPLSFVQNAFAICRRFCDCAQNDRFLLLREWVSHSEMSFCAERSGVAESPSGGADLRSKRIRNLQEILRLRFAPRRMTAGWENGWVSHGLCSSMGVAWHESVLGRGVCSGRARQEAEPEACRDAFTASAAHPPTQQRRIEATHRPQPTSYTAIVQEWVSYG